MDGVASVNVSPGILMLHSVADPSSLRSIESRLPIDPEDILLISQWSDSVGGPACMIYLEQSQLLVHGSLEEVCTTLGIDFFRDQMLMERLVIPQRKRASFLS